MTFGNPCAPAIHSLFDNSCDNANNSSRASKKNKAVTDTNNPKIDNHNQKQKFSAEEDRKLRQLIEINGPRRWNQIALSLPGRTGRQCRDRFQNYLSPSLINGPWSNEEDLLLEQKVYEIGQHWNKIAKFFKGRSSNNVKNRWYTYVSKKKINRKKIRKQKYNFEIKNDAILNNELCNNYYYYLNNNSNNQLIYEKRENLSSPQKVESNLNVNYQKTQNFKRILFPPIYPPEDIIALSLNKELFNFFNNEI